MQHVEANGLRFAYLEAGAGPLVLLLHGFPDTAYTWDRALPALAEAGFRAVAPFMRGYVPSAIPADGDYRTDTLARDALALIDALGGERAVVVGHDWGASAAYGAAAFAPEKLARLVTFAIPHPKIVKPTPALIWKVRHFFAMRRAHAADTLARDDFAYVDELWRRWSPEWKHIPASETAHVKEAFRDPRSRAAAAAYYRFIGARMPESHQRTPIHVPTVAFAGEADLIAPRVYEKARKYFAASYEVVQVPGGHFAHREHPEHVIDELVRVVREAR